MTGLNCVCNLLNCSVGRAGLDPVKANCASRVLDNTPKDDREQLSPDQDGTKRERITCPRCPYFEYRLLTLSVELQSPIRRYITIVSASTFS